MFPECLKKAIVIALHKSGIDVDPKNFRPIFLLPTISKLFEKILFPRINSFLDKNNVRSQINTASEEKFTRSKLWSCKRLKYKSYRN